MAKKVWISLPLTTASEANDAAVVSFLKGGLKKELEAETAAFVMNWLSSKNIPFGIDFERSSVDRALVTPSAPDAGQRSTVVGPEATEAGKLAEEGAADGQVAVAAGEQLVEPTMVATESIESGGAATEVIAGESDSRVDTAGGAGLRRPRGKAARRVPEASKGEE